MTKMTGIAELNDEELGAVDAGFLTEIFGVKRHERLDKSTPKTSGEGLRGGYYA